MNTYFKTLKVCTLKDKCDIQRIKFDEIQMCFSKYKFRYGFVLTILFLTLVMYLASQGIDLQRSLLRAKQLGYTRGSILTEPDWGVMIPGPEQ